MATTVLSTIDEFLARSPIPLYIGGAWRAASDGQVLRVENPADASVLALVSAAGAADVDAAIDSAWSAFEGWSNVAANDRAVLLHRLADAIDANAPEIARLESLDVGKPIRNSAGFDVPFASKGYRYFADIAASVRRTESIPLPGMEARRVQQPLGVVGFIFPWNFPFMLLAWGIAPALAAGNTVVIKPAELTPLSSLYLCHLAEQVGIPAGVINIVPGLGEIAGKALCNSSRLRMISFTGSPEVGRMVAEAAARNLVPSKLELGGKGAAVVFDDVDVAASALASAITLNSGQVCCTATRWLVHEPIFDELVSEASKVLATTAIGPGTLESSTMGPVVSEVQRNRIISYLDRGRSEGASVLYEGSSVVPGGAKGYYVAPTLLTGQSDNVCAREEIFGPVAYVMSFRDEDKAVDAVNTSHYGLANSVWSDDLERANRVAERLVAGNSWINAHNLFAYGLPYGGVNLSGWGGGVNGPDTYFDYMRRQTVARPLG